MKWCCNEVMFEFADASVFLFWGIINAWGLSVVLRTKTIRVNRLTRDLRRREIPNSGHVAFDILPRRMNEKGNGSIIDGIIFIRIFIGWAEAIRLQRKTMNIYSYHAWDGSSINVATILQSKIMSSSMMSSFLASDSNNVWMGRLGNFFGSL